MVDNTYLRCTNQHNFPMPTLPCPNSSQLQMQIIMRLPTTLQCNLYVYTNHPQFSKTEPHKSAASQFRVMKSAAHQYSSYTELP